MSWVESISLCRKCGGKSVYKGRGCLQRVPSTYTRFVKMISGSYTLGWAFTVLLCFKLFHGVWGDCGPPPAIANTIPVKETSGTTGQAVVYACDRSTDFYEIPQKSTTITCQADGSWTDIEEFCTRACGIPERLQFAEPKPGELDRNIFLPNATVSYNCRPGYIRFPGRKTSITCLENYKWSTPEEFCTRRSCGNPGDVDNGNMEAENFLFGSRVTYTCNEGYRLSSRRNYRDCQADGTWSNFPPQCDVVICAAPDKPANGGYSPEKDEYSYMDSVTFSCQMSLEVAGNSSIFCTATGEWSSSSPTCKAVNCPDPVVENAKKTSGFVGPYGLNSAVSFECIGDLVLKGSRSISCNIDSQWEPAIPKCEKSEKISCGNPGDIPNGQVSAPNFMKGSKATYTCNKGYVLTSSVNYRICQENGIWSGSTPECAGISCGDPGKIKNGHVQVSDFFYGSRAKYTCDEGYSRNTTQDYRECQADGTWSEAIACTDESKNISVVVIVVIVLVTIAAVVFIIFILYRYISKKQKRGKPQPDTLNVQYNPCNDA